MIAETRAYPEPVSTDLAAALGIDVQPLRLPPLEVWPAEGLCFVDGRPVQLSRHELDVLAALIAAPGRVIRRERLYELVWGRPMRPRERAVDVYVRKLRVKLSEAAPEWSFIHTHFQVGYRIAPEKQA